MKIKLTELQPKFLHFNSDLSHMFVDTLAEADGISFLCPKCYCEPPVGPDGTHSVKCWFEDKVPVGVNPGPGRWKPAGTGLEDLSFVPGKKSHSVQILGGCNWHGFIVKGYAQDTPT